ncbi:MAG: hypothetical protein ACP5CD_06765 [Thermovirgaceae bacterium]
MTQEAERAFWVLETTESEKFPYKITIEQGEKVLLCLLVRDRWPGARGNIFCLRAEPSGEDETGEELERVPVVNMKQYGKRLSLVLDRTKKKRCDFLFLKKTYKNGSGEYEQIFWQTQKGLTERKSKSRFAVYGTPAMHIVIDHRERYPWNFAECTTERGTLPVGDYALLHDGQIIAVTERKTFENMLSSLSDLRILNQSLGELETWPAPALVAEANFGDFLDPKKDPPSQRFRLREGDYRDPCPAPQNPPRVRRKPEAGQSLDHVLFQNHQDHEGRAPEAAPRAVPRLYQHAGHPQRDGKTPQRGHRKPAGSLYLRGIARSFARLVGSCPQALVAGPSEAGGCQLHRQGPCRPVGQILPDIRVS